MSPKTTPIRNEYRCAVETNQNGKYAVRIRANFGRRAWVLPAYFLASSFDRAMKKLSDSLQFLQQHEDRLWFWGVERSDDPVVAAELLKEIGLQHDRRGEFPRRAGVIQVVPEKAVPAFALAILRRDLASTVGVSRAVAV